MTDVAVIVVGINSKEYVRGCLQSLAQTEWRGYSHQTVYVDNASADGSVEMVRNMFPDVRVIANPRNEGFCRACNEAAAAVDSRYLYLLNNDTVAYSDSVPLLVDFLERTPSAAAAGNRLLNADLTDQWSARRFPTALNALFGRRTAFSRWFPKTAELRDYLYKDAMTLGSPFEVDWIPGSCSLVRREAYRDVGGLPEDMHYWSDAMFCERLHRFGWTIHVVPQARLVHYEGKGTGLQSRDVRRWLISDFHQGAYRFYCEHYELKAFSPARWVAKIGLELRARMLITAARWD